jgi:putative ATPase
VRGSDANASLYWLARMLEAGEDPLYIARRLLRMATEDVGLADNQALVLASSTYQGFESYFFFLIFNYFLSKTN